MPTTARPDLRSLATTIVLSATLCGLASAPAPATGRGDGHEPARSLKQEAAPEVFWIRLAEKRGADHAVSPSDTPLTQRALARRALRRSASDGSLVDARDLPIDPSRVEAVRATGAKVRVESRWLNAVSVSATPAQLRAIARLPFVAAVHPVRASRGDKPADEQAIASEGGVAALDYGAARDQLVQAGVTAMHARGFRGEGVVIGVLDTGFNRVHEAFHSAEHPLEVLAEWDFIDNDANTGIDAGNDPQQHRHGTWILGTLAAYLPGQVVGAAYRSRFVLAKTEVVATETQVEEDLYVAGLEFIEAQGADIATSSLGYIDWYTPEDLDGVTAVTTIAVNIATSNGLVCLTAAGNSGNDGDPATQHLIAPADALDVITCGAVDVAGTLAGFSSDGPTADGRVKPEVLARGVATATVNSTNATGISALSGTSLSTPIVAGVAALVLEARGFGARGEFGVGAMRDALCSTASDFAAGGTTDPLFARGYGIVSAVRAAGAGRSAADLDFNGAVDAADLTMLLGSWGACAEPELSLGACVGDIDGSGATDAEDLAALLAAWGG